MTDRRLKTLLRRLTIPQPTGESRRRTWLRVRAAYHQREAAPAALPRRSFWAGLGLGLAAGTALMLFLLAGPLQRRSAETAFADWSTVVRDGTVLLREADSAFPGRLQAIVLTGGEPQILLDNRGEYERRQPVLVQFKGAAENVQLLTFSGQRMTVMLGGSRESIEVLVSGSGEVLIAGSDYICSPAAPRHPRGYLVQAAALPVEL